MIGGSTTYRYCREIMISPFAFKIIIIEIIFADLYSFYDKGCNANMIDRRNKPMPLLLLDTMNVQSPERVRSIAQGSSMRCVCPPFLHSPLASLRGACLLLRRVSSLSCQRGKSNCTCLPTTPPLTYIRTYVQSVLYYRRYVLYVRTPTDM